MDVDVRGLHSDTKRAPRRAVKGNSGLPVAAVPQDRGQSFAPFTHKQVNPCLDELEVDTRNWQSWMMDKRLLPVEMDRVGTCIAIPGPHRQFRGDFADTFLEPLEESCPVRIGILWWDRRTFNRRADERMVRLVKHW